MLIVVVVKKSNSEKIGFDFVMNSEVLNTGRITKIVQQIGHIITKYKAFSVQLTDCMWLFYEQSVKAIRKKKAF